MPISSHWFHNAFRDKRQRRCLKKHPLERKLPIREGESRRAGTRWNEGLPRGFNGDNSRVKAMTDYRLRNRYMLRVKPNRPTWNTGMIFGIIIMVAAVTAAGFLGDRFNAAAPGVDPASIDTIAQRASPDTQAAVPYNERFGS